MTKPHDKELGNFTIVNFMINDETLKGHVRITRIYKGMVVDEEEIDFYETSMQLQYNDGKPEMSQSDNPSEAVMALIPHGHVHYSFYAKVQK